MSGVTQDERVFLSESPERTLALGQALGRALQGGDVVALNGDLGAGKTWLTKGIAAGLGAAPSEVTSPTFVLMHIYEGRLRLAHFDAYRLRSAGEMLDLGAEEAFYGEGAAVVEWADRVEEALPEDRLDVEMSVAGERSRQLAARARGPRGRRLLEALVGA